jgi:hypothetical protein
MNYTFSHSPQKLETKRVSVEDMEYNLQAWNKLGYERSRESLPPNILVRYFKCNQYKYLCLIS